MTGRLEGRRILLTGASRGIGRASARLLVQEGARVLGVARDAARLGLIQEELGPSGRFHSLALDLGAPDAAARVVAAAASLWGALDVAVHNAGVMLAHDGGISSEAEGVLERSLELNLLTPYRLTRALLPLLERGQEPRVLNVSSGAGTLAGLEEPGIASYRLSKWALNGLTLLQARELAGRISVSAFDPGWVKTDLGGPQAPGVPEDSAQSLVATLLLPWTESGKFYKEAREIPW